MKTPWLLGAAWLLGSLSLACGGSTADTTQGELVAPDPADEPGADGPACDVDAIESCAAFGERGARACREGSDGTGAWTECATFGTCRPDEIATCPHTGAADARCLISAESGQWELETSDCRPASSDGGGSSTPIVLSFDGAPITFTHPAGSFDVVGRSTSFETDWIAASTPWLAVDLDGNGQIDDGAELFGSMTRLPNGQRARNGFEALAVRDANGDGRLTGQELTGLVTWRDENQDRRSQPRELAPLASAGVTAIGLGYTSDRRCIGTACELERAPLELGSARGAAVDVHFSY